MKNVVDISTCPYCGQEDACILGKIVKEQVALGNMGEGIIGHATASVYAVIDQRKSQLTGARIPAIRVFADFCNKCGRAFNFLIEEGHATLPIRAGDPPIFQ